MSVYSEGDAQRIIVLTSPDAGVTWEPATSFGGGNGVNTVLNGSGAPSPSQGAVGDFYVDTANLVLYGPKNNAGWGAGVTLVGPAGATGPTGPPGAAGSDGQTLLSGSGAPSSGLGADGDFYIDTSANTIYGPKTGGSWGSATPLVGPAGATGAPGPSPVVNTDGDPGTALYVGSVDPNVSYTLVAGDVWIELP